jgi:MYXO-CTERM domain-containing protein
MPTIPTLPTGPSKGAPLADGGADGGAGDAPPSMPELPQPIPDGDPAADPTGDPSLGGADAGKGSKGNLASSGCDASGAGAPERGLGSLAFGVLGLALAFRRRARRARNATPARSRRDRSA